MPRNKTLKRGRLIPFRVVPIVLAGGIGYVIGGLNITALRSSDDVSATETISLRFPAQWANPSPAIGPAALTAAMNASAANAASQAQLALLSPEPMVPVAQITAAAPSQAVAQAPIQTAALEQSGASSPDATENAPVLAPPSATGQAPSETRTRMIAEQRRRVVNRPGYMLDDAQIASIKERLELTPDQEGMWPAVEAALRNIAYAHIKAPAAHGAPSDGMQVAAVDPDSVEDLKSAATPLILSFSEEQKEQVRSIAHVMGLDQLASQF